MSTSHCPILLINLASSRGRLQRCAEQLTRCGLSFERIEAVDGRKLHQEDLEEVHPTGTPGYFMPLKSTEIGCYLSHVRALQRMIELDLDHALIMEDDFELGPNFAERLGHVVAALGENHDQVRLEGEFGHYLLERKLPNGDCLVRYQHPLTRALAILWTRRGARKFLQVAHPIRRPVDVQFKHWWEGDLQISYVLPELVRVHEPSASLSTIGKRKAKGLVTRLRRLHYCLQFSLLSHLRQLPRLGLGRMARQRFRALPPPQRKGLILPS